jgi:hypothetical protein
MKASSRKFVDPIFTPAAPPAIPFSDRRKYLARIPVQLQLRLAASRYSGPARSINLSVAGALIETCAPLTPGERVILTVTPPEDGLHLSVCFEVVRIADDQGSSPAHRFGLRVLTDEVLIWQNFLRVQVLK